MQNKYPRYIKICSIYILGLEFTWSIGNPMWFVQEIKNMKEE
jgi:hypothetical protein